MKTNIYFGVENTYTCTSQQREREGKRKRTVMHTSEAGLITRFPLRYFTPFPSVWINILKKIMGGNSCPPNLFMGKVLIDLVNKEIDNYKHLKTDNKNLFRTASLQAKLFSSNWSKITTSNSMNEIYNV